MTKFDEYLTDNGIDENMEDDFNNWINNTDPEELCIAVWYPLHELCTENKIDVDDDDSIKEYLLMACITDLEDYYNEVVR